MSELRSLWGSDGVFNNNFNRRILYRGIADTETAQIIQLLLIMTSGVKSLWRRICGADSIGQSVIRITRIHSCLQSGMESIGGMRNIGILRLAVDGSIAAESAANNIVYIAEFPKLRLNAARRVTALNRPPV